MALNQNWRQPAFSLLLLLLHVVIERTSATLYHTGSDVTITCSKQKNDNDYSFDPSLDVKLASSGGLGTISLICLMFNDYHLIIHLMLVKLSL